MKTKLLKYILFCSFALNISQAKQVTTSEPNLLPTMKTLSQEELKPLLEKLDKAIKSELIEEKEKALIGIAHYITEENMRFQGCYMLAYNNPEIKYRVIDLYKHECSMPMDKELSPKNPWFYSEDGEGGYEELFMSLAESTFDPNIYDVELNPPESYGGLRLLYLTTVNPDKTLNTLLESSLGIRLGKPITPPDFFYHDKMLTGLAVNEAFSGLLSLMCIQSPETLIKNPERVISFVKEHLKHYVAPRKVDDRTDLVYFNGQDYDVRNGSLDVMKLIGTEKDINLIEEIISNAPILDSKVIKDGPYNRREQIKQKGENVIKYIREKSKTDQK
jgi:hypothetical protein